MYTSGSMSDPSELDVTGHCYCGGITYRVQIPAGAKCTFTAYCHCDSCRRAHASPLYQVAGILEPWLEITGGKEHLVEFQKAGAAVVRAFCGQCGTKILNRFPGWLIGGTPVIAFFPPTLDEATQHPMPKLLVPAKINRPTECILDWDKLLETREIPQSAGD